MSRKVRCFIATSLDGFIADAQGEVDWLFTDEDYGYSDFIVGVDALLLGRKTYTQVLSFGQWPYHDLQSYVFTSRPLAPDANVIFVREEATEFIRALKQEAGGDLWLVGGGLLNASCLRAGIVDELIVSIHPILLGAGVPLFDPPFSPQHLTLESSYVYDTGLVQLTYSFNAPGSKVERHWENTALELGTVPVQATQIPYVESSARVQTVSLTAPTPTLPPASTPQLVQEPALQEPPHVAPQVSPPSTRGGAQHTSRSGVLLWGIGIGLAFGVALLHALVTQLVDLPLLFPLLAGVGLGSVLGLLARSARVGPRSTLACALLSGFLALCLMQVGGACFARGAMIEYLASVISGAQPTSKGVAGSAMGSAANSRVLQRQMRTSLEARMSPANTLQLYRQLQSNSVWRTQYYGAGSRFKFSGSIYWLLQGLDALCLILACAATAQFARQEAQQRRAHQAKALAYLDTLKRKVLDIDPEEPMDTTHNHT